LVRAAIGHFFLMADRLPFRPTIYQFSLIYTNF
jgi:hypothetical protein